MMNLRVQFKSPKMIQGESIQDYLTRVSQFKEELEAIGDSLDEDEIVMTALMVSLDLGTHSYRLCVLDKKKKIV